MANFLANPLMQLIPGAAASMANIGGLLFNNNGSQLQQNYQNTQNQLLNQQRQASYSDALNNRNLGLTGQIGGSNQWGTSSYDIRPSGQKLNGQDIMTASLNQQLSPQAQKLWDALQAQFGGNIGGVQLQPDKGYLQRNISRANPRWVQNRQSTERNLIARGITPNSPQWEQAMRQLNKQEADERLGFEDQAFANDSMYQQNVLNNQRNILGQMQGINAPGNMGQVNTPGVDTASTYNQAMQNNMQNLQAQLQMLGNRNNAIGSAFNPLMAGVGQIFDRQNNKDMFTQLMQLAKNK